MPSNDSDTFFPSIRRHLVDAGIDLVANAIAALDFLRGQPEARARDLSPVSVAITTLTKNKSPALARKTGIPGR